MIWVVPPRKLCSWSWEKNVPPPLKYVAIRKRRSCNFKVLCWKSVKKSYMFVSVYLYNLYLTTYKLLNKLHLKLPLFLFSISVSITWSFSFFSLPHADEACCKQWLLLCTRWKFAEDIALEKIWISIKIWPRDLFLKCISRDERWQQS